MSCILKKLRDVDYLMALALEDLKYFKVTRKSYLSQTVILMSHDVTISTGNIVIEYANSNVLTLLRQR